MSSKPVFIYNEQETRYHFHEYHPFNQKRLLLTVELLDMLNAIPSSCIIPPRMASDEELRYVHYPRYIEAVKALSTASPAGSWLVEAEKYGLDTEDTPYFEFMHEVTSMVVGGSLIAAEEVMSGKTDHALHLGGGLHHALASKGAGFCVYNDVSAAIAYIRKHYQARVLYLDTDVHHGDGVQWSFYSDPNVCTVSIHETGKYLFPGSGAVTERGEGEAFGTCINIPLEPYTEDDSWLHCLEQAMLPILTQFKPDVIVSLHGCDAHAFDPLAHMYCSMNIYKRMPELIHQWAHDFCGGRWIAFGGGGYDYYRVVPRAWSLLWLVMIEHPLIGMLSRNPYLPLPQKWIELHRQDSLLPLPTTWLDPVENWEPIPRREAIEKKNRQTLEIALMYHQP